MPGTERRLRWLGVASLLCVAAAVTHCKSDTSSCAVRCGSVCLPASACTPGLSCPQSAPCDPCSGQCRMTCTQAADCSGAAVSCCVSAGAQVCVDRATDFYHCGGCGQSCGADADRCAGSLCGCGALGSACASGQRCCAGACVPMVGDNCRACGVPCDGNDLAAAAGKQVATALSVDTMAGMFQSSNLDGVLDPSETVVVAPSWQNLGGSAVTLTGSASPLASSAGVSLSFATSTASYGTVAAGATASCTTSGGASGACYVLKLGPFSSRPTAHLDASMLETLSTGASQIYTLHIGQSYPDVMPASLYYRAVETLVHLGIGTGCGNGGFCPDLGLSRAEAAIYLARAIAGADVNVPTSGTAGAFGPFSCVVGGMSVFSDVLPADPACKYIHYVAAHGITAGCGSGTYCPANTITRAQYAVFIAVGLLGTGNTVPSSYTDPASGRGYACGGVTPSVHFTDVLPADPLCPHIHYLWARGITTGCTNDTYCPASDTTRSQGADYLVKAWQLLLYFP